MKTNNKETYINTLIDNMSMEDFVDKLTFNDAITEIEEYFDEYFTETMSEVLGRNIDEK